MKQKPGAPSGLIEDRRKPPAPKMAYLAHFEKLILNPPWLSEDKRDGPATPEPKLRFSTAGYDATKARKKIGERFTHQLRGYHPPPPRRSGV